MNERRLRKLLREAPLPAAAEAERRGLAMVEAAFAERRLAPGGRPARRRAAPRAAIALAAAVLLGVALLSPAGAAVRDWIGDAFTAGVPNAERGLTEIPGGGRLSVSSPAGPWVVQPDGSRRLLGAYGEAAWSPHGLYLAATSGRTLTAVEPDGTPHWSLTAPATVRDPRWSPSGYRIAYRSGRSLRVVAGDGTGDVLVAPRAAPVAPAWSPLGISQLAYVDGTGRLVIADTESGRALASAHALPGIGHLQWEGNTLLEASARTIRLRQVEVAKLAARLELARARRLRLPGGGRLKDVALSPHGKAVAVLRDLGSAREPRSEVDVAFRGGSLRRLVGVPGSLGQLVWSPDSKRLLISWPQADQWLFIPADGRGRVQAVGDVAAQFAPGGRGGGPFPSVAGWCCQR